MRPVVSTCALLGLLLGAPGIQAQPAKKQHTGLVVVSGGKEWKMASSVLLEVRRHLKGLKAMRTAVESARAAEPQAELRRLLKQIRRARRSIRRMRLSRAVRRLDRVVERIKSLMLRHGATPGLLRRYRQAHGYLGAAHQLNADTGAAKAAFLVALSVKPDLELSTKYYSPDVIKVFLQIKAKLRRNGTLRVDTDKPAMVLVDGNLAGVAPAEIKGLIPGEHVVEVRRLGYVRITRTVYVDPRLGGTLKARVVKNLDEAPLRAMLRSVAQELRKSRGTAQIAALARRLKVDRLVVCRAGLDEGEASIFDARQGKYVKRVRRISALPGRPPAKVIAQALLKASPVLDLQGGSGGEGGCDRNDDCPSGSCVAGRCISSTPVYKKWWFWTLIGVAAGAVIAGGAVLGTMPERPVIRIRLGP